MSDTIHVDLTEGQSAELRHPRTLKVRERRPFDLAVAEVQMAMAGKSDDPSGEQVIDVADLLVTTLLASWTLELPTPTVEDTSPLEELNVEDYDLLQNAAEKLVDQMRAPKQPDASKQKKTRSSTRG